MLEICEFLSQYLTKEVVLNLYHNCKDLYQLHFVLSIIKETNEEFSLSDNFLCLDFFDAIDDDYIYIETLTLMDYFGYDVIKILSKHNCSLKLKYCVLSVLMKLKRNISDTLLNKILLEIISSESGNKYLHIIAEVLFQNQITAKVKGALLKSIIEKRNIPALGQCQTSFCDNSEFWIYLNKELLENSSNFKMIIYLLRKNIECFNSSINSGK